MYKEAPDIAIRDIQKALIDYYGDKFPPHLADFVANKLQEWRQNAVDEAKCSSCGQSRPVHVVAVFYNQNRLPYCEDCWVEMFCSTITPHTREDNGSGGIAAAGKNATKRMAQD